jgi:hypothetical protein
MIAAAALRLTERDLVVTPGALCFIGKPAYYHYNNNNYYYYYYYHSYCYVCYACLHYEI